MTIFFNELDSINILERNSAKLEGLELGQIRKLAKAYRKAMVEIRNRLLVTQDNTFTEAKLESMLRQIEQSLQVLNSRLNPVLNFGFDTLFEQGVEDSAKEMNSFERHFNGVTRPVPVDAILESTDPDNFLFNQYENSIEGYNQAIRNNFQHTLTQSLVQGRTVSQAIFDIQQTYSGMEWQLARIVRTELHNIYNVSKLKGFNQVKDDYFPDLKKTLYHPIDSRTGEDSKKAAKKDLIVALNKPFVYTFKGKVRKFMSPPDRPNDRAILIPYRDSYDK